MQALYLDYQDIARVLNTKFFFFYNYLQKVVDRFNNVVEKVRENTREGKTK